MPDIPAQFHLKLDPAPAPEAVICLDDVCISLLTSRLVRIEYSPEGIFEARPSQVFWFRHQPVPEFTKVERQGQVEIETEHLQIVFQKDRPIEPGTFSILVKETGARWHFGDANLNNLGGTCRTLDKSDGPVPLERGLVSRSGWSVVDDSNSLVFTDQGWLEPRRAAAGTLDLYFFGYGHAYQDCLRDFTRISGQVPLIPRWALGNWWSRYWEYTQDELTDLMREFKTRSVPLSVCIVDMDWHITQTGNTASGWTGYTWNPELFPDPKAFLDTLHNLGLKTALNLHPAEGVHPHEAMYPEMARRIGIDPQTQEPVPFDLADLKFTQAYFELLHHPNEALGVDFWWLDWQQGTLTKLPGLDPLWWLNHLHAYDRGRTPSRRRFIFSRWGGLGNHRYPIGFSGDTHVSWKTLAFQPYFTATAANVGYGYWSHDIGGHMLGVEDGELYTRWVQFGVFSPILRLHSTKNPYHERRPWGYDVRIETASRRAMQLRHAFIPYLYSMAWRNHQYGPALVQPLYYLAPQAEEAYHCPDEYLFGSELIAAPYTTPINSETRLARQVVWLPEGDWYDFFNGLHYPGQSWYVQYGGLEDIPLFARAGAIVPLDAQPTFGRVSNLEHLELHLFPGADNHFDLYEDDGETRNYQNGIYTLTPVRLAWEGSHMQLQIEPVQGDVSLLSERREFSLVFHNLVEPDQISLLRDGAPLPAAEWRYESESASLRVTGIQLQPDQTLSVRLETDGTSLLAQRDRRLLLCQKLLNAFHLETATKAVLAQQLPAIIQDNRLLAGFTATLRLEQLRALLEVITGAGVHESSSSGEQRIILWNNHADPDHSYQLSVDQTYVWITRERFRVENRPLPRFKVFHPQVDFAEDTWSLRVNYSSLLALSRKSRREGWQLA
jgi:hypothetical protein